MKLLSASLDDITELIRELLCPIYDREFTLIITWNY